MDYFLLAPVFFPILAGISIKFIKPFDVDKRSLNIYVIATLSVTAILAIIAIFSDGMSLDFFSITPELKIFFMVDDIAKLFSGFLVILWLIIGVYSIVYMKHEGKEQRFFMYYLIVLGIIMGIDYSGNIVTLYVFFEVLTFSTIPLIIHSMKKDAVHATYKYLFYSIAGALMGLVFIFFTTQFTTGADFTQGGTLDMAKIAGNEPLLLAIVFLALLGFGTKAYMFPMHGWLPTVHPAIPSSSSAVLSGVISKVGILALIRTVFYVVGPEFIAGTWVQYTWIILAMITVFMGSMMAFKEPLLKRRLAYSSIGQLSYIILGLAFFTQDGFTGALLHVVSHAIIKSALFLVAGAIIYKTEKTRVDELSGIGKQMPITMTCFTILSLSLIGIPPMSGFFSKWWIATGSLSSGIDTLSWLAPVVLLASAFLTAAYLLPISINAFLGNKELTIKRNEANPALLVPMIILAVATLYFGLFPDALISFASGTGM